MVSSSESSSDEESGVSDLEPQSEHNEFHSEESGGEGPAGVTTRNGKKRKRQEVDDEEQEQEQEQRQEENSMKEVLSHAERRRQKKKGKDSPKLLQSREGRQNSVWVGNLSYKTTVEDIKTFFAGAGETIRIHMPTKAGVNRGFAYVDFATSEAKTCAIALSEQPLIGRKLLIKDGDDFTGRPPKTSSQTILKAQKQPPGPTLFLGNLGFETTEADILEMLNAHRRIPSVAGRQQPQQQKTMDDHHLTAASVQPSNSWIRKVRMGTFEDSGLCKGFAFVDFMSTEDATSVLIHPKKLSLNGRTLVVEYASPDAIRRGAPKGPGKVVRPKPLPADGKVRKTAIVERPLKGQKGPKPRMKPGASLVKAKK